MPLPDKAACIGAGVIGAGWVARYLWNGVDVAVYDPHPEAERRCREVLATADASLERLLGGRPARMGSLRFADSLAEAVDGAGAIQESAPERTDVKRKVLAEVDAHAPADALVGSSTSGLLPSWLQADMTRPERFFVSHPFNPVYLLPLVELCAGERTDPQAVARGKDLYTELGMRPLHVRKEIDGFVADRLLEALWREALWLVHDDVASVAEVDDAVRFGAGLRWALMGTYQTYRIAGGEEGMRHFMAQFGPALKWPWTKLMDVPELTDELIEKIAEQSDAQAAGRSPRDLERERDRGLIALLRALEGERLAGGQVVGDYKRDRFRAAAPDLTPDAEGRVRTLTATLAPDQLDATGGLSAAACQSLLDRATAELLRAAGSACTPFATETKLTRQAAPGEGAQLTVATRLRAAGDGELRLDHRISGADGAAVAEGTQAVRPVDGSSEAAALEDAAAERLRALVSA
jgi:carnitine 3-dehydrogenase